jgi:demethylmenaquinone methyltransferase/2-methoxy-6-polyprenyl-1,4-benzoquinol methylase
MNDPYRMSARYYDRLFDRMNKGLKLAGLRMFRPSKGMNVLDVGCGTGTHLELYKQYGCNLYGIDLSPAMLEVAHARLGDSARLECGDATRMPYEDDKFDLILSTLALHEMTAPTRLGVLNEMKRVLKENGRILFIDFHAGPTKPLRGWFAKVVIFLAEFTAGRDHFRNYRQFIADQGLSRLLAQNHLEVKKQKFLAGDAFVLVLAGKTAGGE